MQEFGGRWSTWRRPMRIRTLLNSIPKGWRRAGFPPYIHTLPLDEDDRGSTRPFKR